MSCGVEPQLTGVLGRQLCGHVDNGTGSSHAETVESEWRRSSRWGISIADCQVQPA